jgi:hypothetical protein
MNANPTHSNNIGQQRAKQNMKQKQDKGTRQIIKCDKQDQQGKAAFNERKNARVKREDTYRRRENNKGQN